MAAANHQQKDSNDTEPKSLVDKSLLVDAFQHAKQVLMDELRFPYYFRLGAGQGFNFLLIGRNEPVKEAFVQSLFANEDKKSTESKVFVATRPVQLTQKLTRPGTSSAVYYRYDPTHDLETVFISEMNVRNGLRFDRRSADTIRSVQDSKNAAVKTIPYFFSLDLEARSPNSKERVFLNVGHATIFPDDDLTMRTIAMFACVAYKFESCTATEVLSRLCVAIVD